MTNVALVVLDTLRKDAFDAHFDWLPGRRFENAWAPSHWTVPVHAAMFTGRYPSEVGVFANAERLDCPDPVLAERLSQAGYRTRAFSTNGNISAYFDYDRGFDEFDVNWRAEGWQEELELNEAGDVFDWKRYDSESSYPPGVHALVGIVRSVTGSYDTVPSLRHWLGRKMRGPGSPGFDDAYQDFGATEALEWVRSREFADDEFCFLNLMEAHNPYNPPVAYQTVEPVRIHGLLASVRGPDAAPDRVRAAYDDSVRYLANMYEEIFAELREDFDYVITLGDHGELLGEHDRWEHLCGLYPELTHVPLVITGVEEGEEAAMANLLDVHRTVTSLTNVEPNGMARGRDLLDEESSAEPTLSEYHGLSRLHVRSLSDDERARIATLDTELYGIATPPTYFGYETVDGGFESVGSADEPDPRGTLAALVDGLERREIRTEDYDDMDDDVLERLEHLGYA